MIAVPLTLALYEIGARYIKFNYIPILYNYIVEVGIQHMYLSASVCQHDTTPRNVEAQASHLSPPPDTCNARGHSPNSLVPHVPAYHLLRLLACTSRASALPALAAGKSLNHWASEVSSHLISNAKCSQAGNLDAAFQ